MRFCVVDPDRPLLSVRLACIAALTILFSGWGTCTAVVAFQSCQLSVPQPQIAALSPDTISGDVESIPLIVNGSSFVTQSQIMWNGSALPTTFMDSRHLQTTITQQTLASFGGSPGSTAQISVNSPRSATGLGCPIGGNSATLVLFIN